MLETIEFNWFKEQEKVNIYFDENSCAILEIYKVKKSPYPKYKESARDPFSVIIRGSKELFFSQGYYDIEHPKTGRVELYMAPILSAEGDDINFYYEIVFS